MTLEELRRLAGDRERNVPVKKLEEWRQLYARGHLTDREHEMLDALISALAENERLRVGGPGNQG